MKCRHDVSEDCPACAADEIADLKRANQLLHGLLSNREAEINRLHDIVGCVDSWVWKPIDDEARDGREVLLRHGQTGNVYVGYYGLAPMAFGAGASKNFPWTILDNTNGVNHIRDGGEFGVTHYVEINEAASVPTVHRGTRQGGADPDR